MRKHHTVFQSGCTSLHSHQQCKRTLLSLQPHHHLLFLELLISDLLTTMRWSLIVVLIFISLMSRGSQHFFMCLLASCTLHCWWECKLVQPLWKTAWRFLKKLKLELPYDLAITLQGIYPKDRNAVIRRATCTQVFMQQYPQ